MAVLVAERRRVELDELEVGKGGARGLREQETVADGAARVRRPRPERGVAAGRRDDGGAAERASVVMRSPSTSRIRGCSRARSVRTSAMWRPVSAPPACTTRAREWPPSRPRPSSNRTPSRRSSAIRLGSLLRQQPHRAGTAETAARRERVGCMERGVVVRADGRRDASLGGVAVRAAVRGLGEHEHRGARLGRREGSGEAGDTGSDDDDVSIPRVFASQSITSIPTLHG